MPRRSVRLWVERRAAAASPNCWLGTGDLPAMLLNRCNEAVMRIDQISDWMVSPPLDYQIREMVRVCFGTAPRPAPT